jgi:hypothetical protein
MDGAESADFPHSISVSKPPHPPQPGNWEFGRLTGIPEFVEQFRSLDTLVPGSLRVGGPDVSLECITGELQQLSSPVWKLVFEVIATK